MTLGTVRFGNGTAVRVAIASTPEEMARGLMDRVGLPEDEGMLFWMGQRQDHGFWMKRTRIPLDLLFIDFDKVVGVLTLVPMDERIHRVNKLSTTVLEVNGGWAARHEVYVGQKVQISSG